jgi:mRNA interferase RelE/StbE
MAFKIEFTVKAEKQFAKLGKPIQAQIARYIDELSSLDDPRSRGKALAGGLAGLWRYRVGDFRLLCRLQDETLVLLVLEMGHRKDIYK